jgi:hypothetical protein
MFVLGMAAGRSSLQLPQVNLSRTIEMQCD